MNTPSMDFHFVTYRPYSDGNKKDDLDRYEHFLTNTEGMIEGWSARNTFVPGDLVFFYFGQPLMTLDAVAYVDSEPYVEEIGSWADFSNPVFCDFAPALILAEAVPIKALLARQPKLAQWWKGKPYQSIRRIDRDIAIALLQGIVHRSPVDGPILEPLIQGLIDGDTYTKPDTVISVPRELPALPAPTKPEARPKPKAQPNKKNWTYRDLVSLSWEQFEELVADVFSHLHPKADVQLTRGRGDQGVDVLITDRSTRQVQIVQCKRYRRANKVSSVDMQKFAGAMKKFNARRGYFVTSSSFNAYALDFAQGMDDIQLIDGAPLLKLINDDDLIPPRAEFQ